MNKDNFLFAIIGLLLGCIIGFMFANSVNQNAAQKTAVVPINSTSATPPGHPDISGNGTANAMSPQVQAAIDKANAEPQNFDAQVAAAEMYYQIQRYDEAVKFLKRASELKPDDYETTVNLGNAYFDASQYEEAEKAYTNALAKKSDDVNVRTDLGLTFIFRKDTDYDRAIKEFLTSLEKDPNHVQTLQNLTVAYTKKGDSQKAKETLARLETVDSANTAIPKLREEIQKMGTK